MLARLRADRDFVVVFGLEPAEVGFIQYDDIRHAFFLDELLQCEVFRTFADRAVDDEHRNISFIEYLPGALHAQLAHGALVVHAGRVDNDDRAKRQKLHSFLHGVGRGALDIGHNGDILPRNGVHHAGFTGVALAEKGDVHTVCRGGLVEVCHRSRLPFKE